MISEKFVSVIKMEDEYMDTQDSGMNDVINRANEGGDSVSDPSKDFGDTSGYDDGFDDDDSGNSFRGGRGGRGNFRYSYFCILLEKSSCLSTRFLRSISVLTMSTLYLFIIEPI